MKGVFMEYTFIKHLAQNGVRLFTTEQARTYAVQIGIDEGTITERLYRLNKKGLIERLMKGLYCLSPEFLMGIPIHEYEIATALTTPSCIAFLSAYSFHHLTDQISSTIYVLAPANSRISHSYNTYKIKGITYKIIRTKEEHFFGYDKQWIGQVQVFVSDLERTLIDGLIKPDYCGGFREVLDAYSQAISRLDVQKIVDYAQRISGSVCKRLGWILNKLEVEDHLLMPLLIRPSTSYSKLNPSGPHQGSWNKKWLILENV
jgi:predicted transcriptional regulator of viral defense system